MTQAAQLREVKPEPLAVMRAPFPANQISKLPKESKNQTDERKANRAMGVSCNICGGWHHKNAVHLDYVGHAALTDRLLDADPQWSWEPMSFTADGLPAFDRSGGLWIKLTVCGVTRLGYGCADGKTGGDAIKEIIGDALRNAAMRFGAALDLWHKGDLHADEEGAGNEPTNVTPLRQQEPPQQGHAPAVELSISERVLRAQRALAEAPNQGVLAQRFAAMSKLCAELSTSNPDLLASIERTRDERKTALAVLDDEIPF